jgi:hypothetical protein
MLLCNFGAMLKEHFDKKNTNILLFGGGVIKLLVGCHLHNQYDKTKLQIRNK